MGCVAVVVQAGVQGLLAVLLLNGAASQPQEATGTPAPRQVAQEQSVATLRAQVAASSARLAAATAAWERGRQRLDVLIQRKLATGIDLQRLQGDAEQARARSALLANSLYRSPVDPTLLALLRSDVSGLSRIAMTRRVLGMTSETQRRDADLVAHQAQQTESLLEQQDQAASEAIKLQRRLDDDLATLQQDAQESLAQLNSTLAELRRQRAMAVLGSGPGATCSGPLPAGAVNGFLPISALCPLASAPGHRLLADAAKAFDAMSTAFAGQFRTPLCVTDSYRDYAGQVAVFKAKPNLAATPGRSQHGWGRAVDLCGGVQRYGSAPYQWLQANAARYGWVHPDWAEPDGSRPEPWHWEFRV